MGLTDWVEYLGHLAKRPSWALARRARGKLSHVLQTPPPLITPEIPLKPGAQRLVQAPLRSLQGAEILEGWAALLGSLNLGLAGLAACSQAQSDLGLAPRQN